MTMGRNGGRPFLILTGDLVRAVHQESEQSVAHWWGVSNQTVWVWRKILGVPRNTPGTSDLHGRWSDETIGGKTATERRTEALKRPERAAKIAAPETVEKIRKAMKGKNASKATRERMSAAHRARGTRPLAAGVPWTEAEVALLGTMLDREVAERTGRTLKAVQSTRRVLGVMAFRWR